MKKTQTKTTVNKNSKEFYSFKNYKPNKNAKSVVYNGTIYLSKAQCIALEGITRKELDAYIAKTPESTKRAVEIILEDPDEALGIYDIPETVSNI